MVIFHCYVNVHQRVTRVSDRQAIRHGNLPVLCWPLEFPWAQAFHGKHLVDDHLSNSNLPENRCFQAKKQKKNYVQNGVAMSSTIVTSPRHSGGFFLNDNTCPAHGVTVPPDIWKAMPLRRGHEFVVKDLGWMRPWLEKPLLPRKIICTRWIYGESMVIQSFPSICFRDDS